MTWQKDAFSDDATQVPNRNYNTDPKPKRNPTV